MCFREFLLIKGKGKTIEEKEEAGAKLSRFLRINPDKEGVIRQRVLGIDTEGLDSEEIILREIEEASHAVKELTDETGKTLQGYCPKCDADNTLFYFDKSSNLYVCPECGNSYTAGKIGQYQSDRRVLVAR